METDFSKRLKKKRQISQIFQQTKKRKTYQILPVRIK